MEIQQSFTSVKEAVELTERLLTQEEKATDTDELGELIESLFDERIKLAQAGHAMFNSTTFKELVDSDSPELVESYFDTVGRLYGLYDLPRSTVGEFGNYVTQIVYYPSIGYSDNYETAMSFFENMMIPSNFEEFANQNFVTADERKRATELKDRLLNLTADAIVKGNVSRMNANSKVTQITEQDLANKYAGFFGSVANSQTLTMIKTKLLLSHASTVVSGINTELALDLFNQKLHKDGVISAQAQKVEDAKKLLELLEQ